MRDDRNADFVGAKKGLSRSVSIVRAFFFLSGNVTAIYLTKPGGKLFFAGTASEIRLIWDSLWALVNDKTSWGSWGQSLGIRISCLYFVEKEKNEKKKWARKRTSSVSKFSVCGSYIEPIRRNRTFGLCKATRSCVGRKVRTFLGYWRKSCDAIIYTRVIELSQQDNAREENFRSTNHDGLK